MKIVCDSCSAKYSIADEKVAGKVFKIRCKKCSEVIVVRGDQLDEPKEESTQVYDYGDENPDSVWHAVVDGDQQGPFDPGQLGEMLTAGTIDWEVYVWREGFENWLAARDVPELVEAITGQPQDGAAPVAAAAADVGGGADAFGAPADDPYAAGASDPGPAADAGAGDGLFAATGDAGFGGDAAFGAAADSGDGAFGADSGGGADLFAQQDAGGSPFEAGGGDDEVVASSPGPRVSADQAMTGQRNENSVLFSLSNLQALATGGPSGSSSSTSSPISSPTPKAGHASGEGSGLIDIKALASATGVSGGMGASGGLGGGGSASKDDSVDHLLSIGTGSPIASGLGAPVLAPVQEEKSGKGLIIAVAAVGGIVAIAAAAVIAVVLTSEPEPVAIAANGAGAGTGAIAAGEGTAAAPTTDQGAADPAPAPTAAPAATPTADEGTDDEGATGDEGDEGDEAAAGTGSRRRRARSGGGSTAMTTTASNPTPAAAPATMSTGGGGDIDDLLNAALGGMMSSAPAMMAAPAGGNLPEAPPRDGVLRALRSVQGAVGNCGGGQHGVANTTITVSGTNGRVTNARVTGQFAGTPVGSCVARAVRGARFPRFSRPTFQVSFPYRI